MADCPIHRYLAIHHDVTKASSAHAAAGLLRVNVEVALGNTGCVTRKQACEGLCGLDKKCTWRQGAQVRERLAPRAEDALVAEGPQRALEARLVLGRHAHARKAQALAHLRAGGEPYIRLGSPFTVNDGGASLDEALCCRGT